MEEEQHSGPPVRLFRQHSEYRTEPAAAPMGSSHGTPRTRYWAWV